MRFRFQATALCALLVVASCTGGGATATTTGASTTTNAPTGTVPITSSTSTPKKADGLPITIGVTFNPSLGTVGEVSFSDVMNAASAQINESLGGIQGRPIHLVACPSSTDAEGLKCAADLTNAHVELVVSGRDTHIEFGAFRSKRIPVFATRPTNPADGKLFGVSFFSGGQDSEFETMLWFAVRAASLGAKSIGVIAPRGRFAANDIVALTNRLAISGVKLSVVEGSPTPSAPELETLYKRLLAPASFSSATTSAVPLTTVPPNEVVGATPSSSSGAISSTTVVLPVAPPIDTLLVLYDDDRETCVNAIRARSALSVKLPAMAYSRCGDSAVLNRVADDAQGWSFVGGVDRTSDIHKAIATSVGAYTKALSVTPDLSDDSVLAFEILMTIVDTGNRSPVAQQAVGSSIADSMTSGPRTMWDGSSYQCGQSENYVAICVFGNVVRSYVPNDRALGAPAGGSAIVGELPPS